MSARLFWYPTPGGALRMLNLGRPWSELIDEEATSSAPQRTVSGRRSLTVWSSWTKVRALCEYLPDGDVVRELQAIVNALKVRGAVIGLAEEADCTWGGFLRGRPSAGKLTLEIEENMWQDWPGTPSLTAGDVVVVQGPSPKFLRERAVVASRSGRQITLAAPGLLNDYSEEEYVFVHDARFWPWLELQDGALNGQVLQTAHRITWTLDLQLQEPVSRIVNGAEQGGSHRGEVDVEFPDAIVIRGLDYHVPEYTDYHVPAYTGGVKI